MCFGARSLGLLVYLTGGVYSGVGAAEVGLEAAAAAAGDTVREDAEDWLRATGFRDAGLMDILQPDLVSDAAEAVVLRLVRPIDPCPRVVADLP